MKNINQAVILAGGRGLRLRPITNKIPKPMVKINNAPFLDYLIFNIIKHKITNILILTGYKSKKIENYYSSISNINIKFSKGKLSDLTGTRLIKSYNFLKEDFLLVYSDNYWNIQFNLMKKKYFKSKSLILATIFNNKNGTSEYGYKNNVFYNKKKLIKSYTNKPNKKYYNGVNIGFFIVNKKCLPQKTNKNISFENIIFKKIIQKNQALAYVTNKQYYYITDKKALNNFLLVSKKKRFKPLPKKYFI